MQKYLIIATEKDSRYPNSIEHITAYGIYLDRKNERGQWLYEKYTKERFFKEHYSQDRKYISYNISDDDSAELYVVPNNGRPYLKSVASSTLTDNLLHLDNIK